MKRCVWWALATALIMSSLSVSAQIIVESPAQAVDMVANSVATTREKLAVLPSTKNDAEKIVRMMELEQAPRLVMAEFDLSRLDEGAKQEMWAAVWRIVSPIDDENRSALLAMVPAEGWFSIKSYGPDAARAAFLIIQHSSPDLWRRFLPKIAEMAAVGEADGQAYALMYDRLALSEGRAKRYGSQMICKDGRYVVREPVEDVDAIDVRRKEVGLGSLAENLKRFENGC